MLALVNAPVLMSLATRAKISANGERVSAEVVGGRLVGDADDPAYRIYYRFPTEVDEEQDSYSAEVDRATYTRARETSEVAATVVPGDAIAHRVDGEVPQRLGLWLTLGIDALVLLLVVWRWSRRRRGRAGDDPASGPLPQSAP